MTGVYVERQNYKDTPCYPLRGEGIEAEDYVASPLADWTRAALELDGETEFLRIAHDSLPQPEAATPDDAAELSAENHETTELSFGRIRHPAELRPGEAVKILLELDRAYPGQQLGLHVHWMKARSWGGFSQLTRPQKLSETRYAIEFTPKTHPGLVGYNLLPYLSPDGSWGEKTQNARVSLPLAPPETLAEPSADGPWTVDIRESSLIVETHLKTRDRDGILVSKMQAGVGYELALKDGALVFQVGCDAGGRIATSIEASAMARGTMSSPSWTAKTAASPSTSMESRPPA